MSDKKRRRNFDREFKLEAVRLVIDSWLDAGFCVSNRFYIFHNNADKTFTAVDDSLGIDLWNYSFYHPFSGIYGDYDNDGDDDLYVCGHQGVLLYRNDGVTYAQNVILANENRIRSACN